MPENTFDERAVTDGQRLIRVEVLINGRPQQLHRCGGRAYVAGKPGDSYTVRIRNLRVSRRIEVVCAIDARSIMTNEPAILGPDLRGMALDAGSEYVFQGWRLDDGSVRRLVFWDDSADTVAAQATGNRGGLGVIGLAAYLERLPVTFATRRPFGSKGPGGSKGLGGSLGGSDLGTAMGEVVEDPIGRTQFPRDDGDPATLAIGYATAGWIESHLLPQPEPFARPGSATGYEAFTPVSGGRHRAE